MNVEEELQTKVAPPCKMHAISDKSEYLKQILGKSDVYHVYDSTHMRIVYARSIQGV